MPPPPAPSDASSEEVLVIEDDPRLAEFLAEWIAQRWKCDTLTAWDGTAEPLGRSTDVVVLERSIPDGSVATAVETIWNQVGAHVVILSSLEPAIEEIVDLPFDAFLRKPVTRNELLDAIDRLLLRRSYLWTVERYCSIQAKLDLFESALRPNELAQHDEYAALSAEADELRRQIDGTLTELVECSPG